MIIKRLLITLLVLLMALVATLLITEWHPDAEERRCFDSHAPHLSLPDTLTLVSWNIGYAGLDAQMDFFYDGGEMTRGSREQAERNMQAIISELSAMDADFVLLQEVDFDSKRSYGVNQYERITRELDYPYYASALNYNSIYVPIPLGDPMGRVRSGVVTLSRHPIKESVRRQYPSIVDLPNRLFDLKRCMLSLSIATTSGEMLWINNTHNSAFDDGGEARRAELSFICDIIDSYPLSMSAGDWNSTPPGYTPSQPSIENIYFSPYPLSMSDLPEGSHFHLDYDGVESVRYLDRAYSPGSSTTTLVDFGVGGARCAILNCEILDLGFANSDHNPVFITFVAQ